MSNRIIINNVNVKRILAHSEKDAQKRRAAFEERCEQMTKFAESLNF